MIMHFIDKILFKKKILYNIISKKDSSYYFSRSNKNFNYYQKVKLDRIAFKYFIPRNFYKKTIFLQNLVTMFGLRQRNIYI